MNEMWIDIAGFEGRYQVSNHGSVRSLIGKGRVLKPGTTRRGYQFVVLTCNGKSFPKTVHRLVASAFIPNPENKEQVNHKDTIKTNNVSDNLEWTTRHENIAHAVLNCPRYCGRGNPRKNSKLTSDDVLLMRVMHYMYNVSGAQLERLFGLNQYSSYPILRYQTWKHI